MVACERVSGRGTGESGAAWVAVACLPTRGSLAAKIAGRRHTCRSCEGVPRICAILSVDGGSATRRRTGACVGGEREKRGHATLATTPHRQAEGEREARRARGGGGPAHRTRTKRDSHQTHLAAS
jgi:hypothetical protein